MSVDSIDGFIRKLHRFTQIYHAKKDVRLCGISPFMSEKSVESVDKPICGIYGHTAERIANLHYFFCN